MTDDEEINDWELIDICEECGLWDQENHPCEPNNRDYTPSKFEELKATARRRRALKAAADVIKVKKAQIMTERKRQRELEEERRKKHQMEIITQLEKKSRNLLYETEKFRDEFRMALRIPQGELEINPDQKKHRDEGLMKLKTKLNKVRHEIKELSDEWNIGNGIGGAKEIHSEIETVFSSIENLKPWRPPKQTKQECTCIDFPSHLCPLHPGRNPRNQ